MKTGTQFLITSITGAVVFAALVILFIFPSFLYGGVDCIAGCVQAQGWPLAYRSVLTDAFVDTVDTQQAFDIVPLLADIAIWLGVAVLYLVLTRRNQVARYAIAVILVAIAVRMLMS